MCKAECAIEQGEAIGQGDSPGDSARFVVRWIEHHSVVMCSLAKVLGLE